MTTTTKSLDGIVVLYKIVLNNDGDKYRLLNSTFENITAVDIYTNTDFLLINGYNVNFTIKNLYFKNVNLLA